MQDIKIFVEHKDNSFSALTSKDKIKTMWTASPPNPLHLLPDYFQAEDNLCLETSSQASRKNLFLC